MDPGSADEWERRMNKIKHRRGLHDRHPLSVVTPGLAGVWRADNSYRGINGRVPRYHTCIVPYRLQAPLHNFPKKDISVVCLVKYLICQHGYSIVKKKKR